MDTEKDPGVLKKLGSKVHEVVSGLKSLPPNESEAESIRDKNEQVNALAPHQEQHPTMEDQPSPYKIAPIDHVRPINDPLSTYGNRPGSGEVLYATDKDGNITPVRVAPPAPAAEKKEQPAPAPAQKSALKPIVPESLKEPMPLYDDGGDVDVNDGKHQVAILQDGERVLTPEENERYKKEHPKEATEGAPADFGGRVISNPKGLKPILDTEIERPSDTDRLPKGAKLSTDNAPAETPQGDISNPPAADIKPEAMREISTSDKKPALRPYSEVVEEKAKAAAKDKVNNPGVQTETSNVGGEIEEKPEAEEKPKPTLGQTLAENWLKKIGSFDVSKMQKPESLNAQPSQEGGEQPQGGAPQGPQSPLKPIVNPNEGGPAKPALDGKEAYHQKIAQYDKTFQDLMDKAAATNDPALREQAARVREAKLEYEKLHPWGAKESAHPGILGKIGHVAEQVATRTPVLSPIMATFPQSEVGQGEQRAAAREQVEKAAGETTARDAAEAKADKQNADKYTLKEVTDTRPDSPTKGQTVYAGVNNTDPTDIRWSPLQPAPKQTAGADKAAFASTLKKIGTPEAADPSQQKQALETAHNAKVITDDEYKGALAYLGSTANAPATQAAQAEQKRTAGKTMYFNTPTGRKALTAAEAKAQGFDPAEGVVENETQVAKDREKASTYRVIKRSLEQYKGDISGSQLTPQDITTMTTITEDAEKPDYISKLIAGGFDDLLGHPVTGYSEKLMKGTLTKNQYQDMSPAARKLVADYYTTMMAHFANMKAAQGTIPRNPFIIQTEMHTIPKPFLSEEEAKPAFDNYLDQVGMRNSDNVDFGGATGAPKAPAVTAPTGATAEVVKDGKVIGHVVVQDGKKVYQPLQ